MEFKSLIIIEQVVFNHMYIHIFSINFTVLKYVQYAECLLLETEMTDANINVKPISQIF